MLRPVEKQNKFTMQEKEVYSVPVYWSDILFPILGMTILSIVMNMKVVHVIGIVSAFLILFILMTKKYVFYRTYFIKKTSFLIILSDINTLELLRRHYMIRYMREVLFQLILMIKRTLIYLLIKIKCKMYYQYLKSLKYQL